jgi:hypothetical protein
MRKGTSPLLLYSLLLWNIAAHCELNDHFRSWRVPANGGINALYCYLSVNGVSCGYTNLLRWQTNELGTGTHTALTLAHLAAKAGLPLRPASVTIKELETCKLPVIVHIDGESPDAGAFLLLYDISTNGVYYVDGPTASIHTMSLESFCRTWSGIVLLPPANSNLAIVWYVLGIGFGVITIPILQFARRVTCP